LISQFVATIMVFVDIYNSARADVVNSVSQRRIVCKSALKWRVKRG